MLVIIPNPNQTTELIRMQKEFIKKANSAPLPHPVFYQNAPLWIFIEENNSFTRDFSKDELKKFSAELTKVELDSSQVYFSKNLQQIVLGIHSRISTTKITLQGELVLCQTATVVNGTSTSECIEPLLNLCKTEIPGGPSKSFPLQLKVFRVANAVKPDSHSFAVTDFVWKKFK
ncbi:MAG: hypothetical protein K6C98_06995 [Treponema sp.]|nr:hypothetical protein [Treponema sp.]